MHGAENLLEEGVLWIGRGFKVRFLNFAAAKFLDLPLRHVVGRSLDAIDHSVLHQAKELLIKSGEQGCAVSQTLSIEGKGYFELVAEERRRGRGVVVLRDRTDQRQVIEMGKAFVANASHELRTPITIIKGFAETLQDVPNLSKEVLQEITEKMVRNCSRMENLVKSLLTLADLETLPASRLQECDVLSVIETCAHLLAPLYPEASLEVCTYQDSALLRADPHILELALFNLFENAAKYSAKPAVIAVDVLVEGEELHIAIKDQGIGIASQDLERIFDRFYTVDKARSRKLGGAGIGLSIVKTVVQKLDGTITVSSEMGKGTTFHLTLPLKGVESF